MNAIQDEGVRLPIVLSPEDILVMVAGGPGKHSAVVPSCTFSRTVTTSCWGGVRRCAPGRAAHGCRDGLHHHGYPLGAPAFGAILEASDSWAAAWGSLAALSAAAAPALSGAGSVIDRESGS